MKETKHDDPRVIHKSVRVALGKTQKWLSYKLRIPSTSLSNYERGTSEELYSEEMQKKIGEILDYEMDRQVKDAHGEWYRDIILLKVAINIVEACKYNPKEQKKAYNNILKPILMQKNITPWIYIVKDPAFGEMELFKEDDSSE